MALVAAAPPSNISVHGAYQDDFCLLSSPDDFQGQSNQCLEFFCTDDGKPSRDVIPAVLFHGVSSLVSTDPHEDLVVEQVEYHNHLLHQCVPHNSRDVSSQVLGCFPQLFSSLVDSGLRRSGAYCQGR